MTTLASLGFATPKQLSYHTLLSLKLKQTILFELCFAHMEAVLDMNIPIEMRNYIFSFLFNVDLQHIYPKLKLTAHICVLNGSWCPPRTSGISRTETSVYPVQNYKFEYTNSDLYSPEIFKEKYTKWLADKERKFNDDYKAILAIQSGKEDINYRWVKTDEKRTRGHYGNSIRRDQGWSKIWSKYGCSYIHNCTVDTDAINEKWRRCYHGNTVSYFTLSCTKTGLKYLSTIWPRGYGITQTQLVWDYFYDLVDIKLNQAGRLYHIKGNSTHLSDDIRGCPEQELPLKIDLYENIVEGLEKGMVIPRKSWKIDKLRMCSLPNFICKKTKLQYYK